MNNYISKKDEALKTRRRMLVADAPRPRRLDKKLRSKNTIEMKSKKELVACSCRPGNLKLGGD
jgi:hypothetical protein